MVAAANSDHGVSLQTHSVEGLDSGGVKRSKGAKKSTLGVFAKLLAGLTRKAGTGGEEAGEIGTEGLKGTKKPARGLKNASGKGAESPGAPIPVPDNEKIQNRDRRFLAALKEEGEAPEAALQNGPAKKSKGAQKNPEGEEALPFAAAEAASGALPPEDLSPGGLHNGGAADQDGLFRPAGAEGQVPDAAEDILSFRGRRGEGPGASVSADAGLETPAGAEAAAAASRHTRGAGWEEPGAAKKERASTAETKNSRKNRERFALEVRDLRTEGNGAVDGAANGAAPGTAGELQGGAGAERVADLVVELKNGSGNQESAQAGQPKTAGQAFEDILARELHQNLNGDIVRQASILVKDGGEGTIRLSLKPESLGMVKVRLEMAENKITGRIIVESNEALRAFEREIHYLEQAFRDSGFAGASLEMALAGDGGQNSREQWDGDAARALFSSRAVSSNYDAMGEALDMFAVEAGLDLGPGVSRVNVLA
jgi:hypothetical protein